jgi:hypothetical protein
MNLHLSYDMSDAEYSKALTEDFQFQESLPIDAGISQENKI